MFDASTTLSVVIGGLALAGAAFIGVYAIIERARTVRHISNRSNRRSRQHELHWTAIRFRNQGLIGSDLQEAICQTANCTPTDADAAIVRVGADL